MDIYDSALEYMELWRDHEGWSDLNIMLNQGADLLAADWLVSAGAIDPDLCYSDVRDLEREVVRLAAEYRALSDDEKQAIHARTFKGVYTFTCPTCNHVSFVGDGNHLLYATELKACWSCGDSNVQICPPETEGV